MGNFITILLAEGEGDKFAAELLTIISYISMAIGAVFALWAIYLWFLMATASNAEKRNKVKERIVKALSGLFIIAVLVLMLQVMAGQADLAGEGE